jgi:hypothetical protein
MLRDIGVVLGAASLVVGLGATPAYGEVTGSVSSPGTGVLYDDCRSVLVPYSLDVSPGTDSWSMDVVAYGPDGTQEASDYVSSFSDPSTGNAALLFCGYEMPGSYTVAVEDAAWSDYESDIYSSPFSVPGTTFTMRLPKSKTTLKKKAAGEGVRLTVQVKDERPAGYFPTEYATVRLEALIKGKWRRVPHSKALTDERGREVWRIGRVGRVVKLRAVTLTDHDDYTGSESRPVTVAARLRALSRNS